MKFRRVFFRDGKSWKLTFCVNHGKALTEYSIMYVEVRGVLEVLHKVLAEVEFLDSHRILCSLVVSKWPKLPLKTLKPMDFHLRMRRTL